MFSPGWLPNKLGGECQGFHLGRQAALIASCFVLVEDAFVSNRVHNGLHLGKQFGSFGFVASQDSFLDVLHRSAVLRAQRGVGSVDFDVLTDAFTA